mmetsp:Transcript_63264/g.135959  ORF Transcript_63264/g.135959 Transcript_63264/m.135959 type:complete len:545 (-) Transcript_63264:70-1704(-)
MVWIPRRAAASTTKTGVEPPAAKVKEPPVAVAPANAPSVRAVACMTFGNEGTTGGAREGGSPTMSTTKARRPADVAAAAAHASAEAAVAAESAAAASKAARRIEEGLDCSEAAGKFEQERDHESRSMSNLTDEATVLLEMKETENNTGLSGDRECLLIRGERNKDRGFSDSTRNMSLWVLAISTMVLGAIVILLCSYQAARDYQLVVNFNTTSTSTSTTVTTISTVLTTTTTFPVPEITATSDGKPVPITFVTAETRGVPLLVKVNNFEHRFHTEVLNIGTDQEWEGYFSKVKLLAVFLRDRVAKTSWEDLDRDLIAFVDGSDIFWGGCSFSDFMHSYERIVSRSGAKVVFGAEVACGEQDCNRVPDVPAWANRLAGENVDLNSGYWSQFATDCKGTWNDACSAKRDCGFTAPCAVPPAVKFLNSGFFIGPVLELSRMLEWSLSHYKEFSVFGDQSVFAQYWLDHQNEVVLDYTGELTTALSEMNSRLTQAVRGSQVGSGSVRNNAFGHKLMCLIHGNGRGIFAMKNILYQLEGTNDLKQIRGW